MFLCHPHYHLAFATAQFNRNRGYAVDIYIRKSDCRIFFDYKLTCRSWYLIFIIIAFRRAKISLSLFGFVRNNMLYLPNPNMKKYVVLLPNCCFNIGFITYITTNFMNRVSYLFISYLCNIKLP